jgi:hypothetical protein
MRLPANAVEPRRHTAAISNGVNVKLRSVNSSAPTLSANVLVLWVESVQVTVEEKRGLGQLPRLTRSHSLFKIVCNCPTTRSRTYVAANVRAFQRHRCRERLRSADTRCRRHSDSMASAIASNPSVPIPALLTRP